MSLMLNGVDAAIEGLYEIRQTMETAERRGFVRAVRMLRRCYQMMVRQRHWEYPRVPPPMRPVPKYDDKKFHPYPRVPAGGGVYFIWSDGVVQYVGTSRHLVTRIDGYHDNIKNGDLVSWIEFDENIRLYAESFYIGLLRPPRNMQSNQTNEGAK